MKTNTILTIAGVGLGVLLLTTKKDGENITFTLGGGGYASGVGASNETPQIYNITNEYNIPPADLSGLFDYNQDNMKNYNKKKSTMQRLREPLENMVNNPNYQTTKSIQQRLGVEQTFVDDALNNDPMSINNILNKKSDIT
jgi:hypothetical protein